MAKMTPMIHASRRPVTGWSRPAREGSGRRPRPAWPCPSGPSGRTRRTRRRDQRNQEGDQLLLADGRAEDGRWSSGRSAGSAGPPNRRSGGKRLHTDQHPDRRHDLHNSVVRDRPRANDRSRRRQRSQYHPGDRRREPPGDVVLNPQGVEHVRRDGRQPPWAKLKMPEVL